MSAGAVAEDTWTTQLGPRPPHFRRGRGGAHVRQPAAPTTGSPNPFDCVPPELKRQKKWVVWKAGKPKADGKFSKVPIDPKTDRNINGNDPQNHMTFDRALELFQSGCGSGIGIALTDEPVAMVDGNPLWLVALDFDNCTAGAPEAKAVWLQLGKPYREVSPSGKGIRMFALSRERIKGGNAHGREMYARGRFMTVTGVDGKGELFDATEGLLELEGEWFPEKPPQQPKTSDWLALPSGTPPQQRKTSDLGATLAGTVTPESPEQIERVKGMLACVSADCSYEQWRNVVWSVLSTGWGCAEDLARTWSQSAPGRYDENGFDNLVSVFDPCRGITLGTLTHMAKKAGWTPPSPQAHGVQPGAEHPSIPAASPTPSRLITAAQLAAMPVQPYRVRDLLPAKGVAAVYGPSGSGKSFLVMDLAMALAEGATTWFGHKLKAAPVAYVALEGQGGLRQRVKAWEIHHKQTAPHGMRFLLGGHNLLDRSNGERLAADIQETLGPGAVVVIDTLNQATPGADENSSQDMGLIITNAQRLAELIDGLVILVHHTGKDAARGLRGHSSLLAALDAAVEVRFEKGTRSWHVAKSKDGDPGGPRGFELVPHVVWLDDDGLDVSSCAVRQTLMAPVQPTRPLAGKRQKAVMEKLQVVLRGAPEGMPLQEAATAAASATGSAPKRQATDARAVILTLIKNGHLFEQEGKVSLHPQ